MKLKEGLKMERDKSTLLVVDDIPQNIQLVSDILREQYRVLFATERGC